MVHFYTFRENCTSTTLKDGAGSAIPCRTWTSIADVTQEYEDVGEFWLTFDRFKKTKPFFERFNLFFPLVPRQDPDEVLKVLSFNKVYGLEEWKKEKTRQDRNICLR